MQCPGSRVEVAVGRAPPGKCSRLFFALVDTGSRREETSGWHSGQSHRYGEGWKSRSQPVRAQALNGDSYLLRLLLQQELQEGTQLSFGSRGLQWVRGRLDLVLREACLYLVHWHLGK